MAPISSLILAILLARAAAAPAPIVVLIPVLGSWRGLAIGNGILTTENEAQTIERADPAKKDKGGDAARAALSLIAIKRQRAKK